MAKRIFWMITAGAAAAAFLLWGWDRMMSGGTPEAPASLASLPYTPSLDEESLQRLRELTTGARDAEVRWAATELLVKLQDAESFYILQDRIAKDPDASVRQSAIKAMADLEDPACVPILTEALRDRDPGVRRKAAENLGRIGDPNILQHLKALLKDPHKEVRQAAGDAAERIRSRAAGVKDPEQTP